MMLGMAERTGGAGVTCPRCQQPNPAGARFCEQCATPLGRTCASCGTSVSATAKFCHACAHPVADTGTRSRSPESYIPKHLAEKILTGRRAIEGERKQVTVLFADLKGSMELIAHRDPEEARNLLERVVERMLDAVHRYEGTVSNVMGDGIMALFGAPLAHADHAVRACYAALQMQESVKRYAEEVQRAEGVAVQIRVGLNSGEVVVGAIGNDLRMDYTAVGHTTHLAARMEQTATPGSILITPQTAALAKSSIRTRALGPRPVKGLETPIEVYEVLGGNPRPRAGMAYAFSDFVGRQAELAHLRRALDRARAGTGQVVALVGEPGVGKSRLVRELIESVQTQGCLVLECGSVSHGKVTPYLPVADLLRAYFEVDAHADERTIRDSVVGRLRPLDRSLEALAPAFLALLDVGADGGEWAALDPPQRRQRTLDACKRLVLKESQIRPVVLVFEDLHWFDSESLAVLDMVVESLPAARILLLVTYRPEHRHDWARKSYYTQLRIDPLPSETVHELLDARLGDDVSLGPLKQILVRRTEGNPFFLEETVRTLIETGDLIGDPGAHRLARDVTIIQVPSTVNVVIAARIDRLSPPEKRLLQCAAVVGKNVRFALLAAIAELSEDELQRALAHLQAGEFLYETSLFPDLEYTFRHTLTHEVAYASLLHEQRRVYHQRILEAIERLYADRLIEEVEWLAQHAVRGGLWEKAVAYLSQAGRKAAARSAHVEAVAWFEQALEALERLPPSRELLERAVDLRFEVRQSCVPLRDDRRVLGHLREAEATAERIGDRARLGWVFAYRTNGLFLAGDCRGAVEAGQRALALAVELGDPCLEESANAYLAQAYHWLGSYRRAAELLRRNVTTLERELQGRDLPGKQDVNSRTFLAWCLAELGDFTEGRAHADRAVGLAESSGSAYAVVHACSGAGLVHLRQGQFAQAIAAAERAVDLCRDRDFSALWAIPASILGLAYLATDRPHDAIPLLEQAVDVASVLGAPVLGFLGEAYLLSGRVEDAHAVGARALELCVERSEQGWEAWTLRLLGDVAARRDPRQPAVAEDAYRQALRAADELGMRPLVARSHLALGEHYGTADKRQPALEHLAAAAAMVGDMAMGFWLQQAEATRQQLG
jgi:class 3 adenylate cyclase/tetratricopeptide (TPR) repeat protein